MAFGERLAAAMDEAGPLCVGIDPHPELLARDGAYARLYHEQFETSTPA